MNYDPNNPQSQPVSPTPPQPAYQQPAYQPPQSTDNNSSLAIASLVLGIASYVVLPILGAIAAIILGAIATSKMPKGTPNRGMGTAGIVLGIVNIVLCILAIIVFFGFIAAVTGWYYY